MSNIKVEVPEPHHKADDFPCECGKAFQTAEAFSDHVHREHLDAGRKPSVSK